MTWTIKLASAAKRLAAESGTLNETAEALVASGRLASLDQLQELISLAANAAKYNVLLTVKDGLNETFDIANSSEELILGQEVRIRVSKGIGSLIRFFTFEGFCNGLTSPDVARCAKRILIAEEFAPFRSLSCDVQPWDEEANRLDVPVGAISVADIDPRKIVRDLTGNSLPPLIDFWLLAHRPEAGSRIFDAWVDASAIALIGLPAAEIWPDGSECKVTLAGPRKRTLRFNAKAIKPRSIHAALTDAVRWVCDVPREAEVRHTLLVKRLATEWPADDPPWEEGLPRVLGVALDGAKADYKAHLHEKTAETLKALGDLRKALNEETAKVVERTQGLTAALFRDLALAIGAISVRMLALAGNGKDLSGTRYVVLAMAIWMIVSLLLSLKTNRRFLRLQSRMRASWHRRIHAVLSSRDFNALARRPLKEATKAYRDTAQWVGLIYLVLAFALVAIGVVL